MRFPHLGYALLLTIPFIACKGKDSASAEGTDSTIENVASKSSVPNTVFPAKSGIIEWQGNMVGEMTATLYFDDNGAKRATYTTITDGRFDLTTRSVEIEADGWIILYDPDEKTGTRMRRVGTRQLASSVGISEIPEGAADLPGVEELEPRTVLGKETRGYAMETRGMMLRSWIWEKIPMRTEMDRGGKEPTVMEVTRLELGVAIPADKFAIPADIVITEVSK
jgi:hypothetical protein